MELILGKPQSQKTEMLREMALKAAAANRFGKVWYLVPEQYTLQTQRELIRQNENKGLLNLEVLSFNRLVYRLQNELQTAGKVPLKASGKAALVYRILSEQPKRFPVLAKKRNSLAFVKNLVAMMTECYQYRITPELLRTLAGKLEGELIRDKTEDLAELLEKYQKTIKDEYFVVEAALANVAETLKKLDLSDTEVFVDGFYGFVPMQIEILSAFMRRAKSLRIAFPYAVEKGEKLGLEDLRYSSELYFDVKNTIRRLRDAYPEGKEQITVIEAGRQGISPEIRRIEEELFQSPKKPATTTCEHIHMAEAATMEEELRYVAEKILYYVHKKGYRFSEIAVLAGNLEEYVAKAEQIFSEYRLTYFLDRKQTIKFHPLLLFVESALLTVKGNFRYEDLMRHLKNIYIYPNLADDTAKQILEDEISVLDIYALEHGLQGKQQYAALQDLSVEIKTIFEDLFTLDQKLKQRDGFAEKLAAVEEYLERRGVFANVEVQIRGFEEATDWIRQSEYRQAAEKLREYFTEMRQFMELELKQEDFDHLAEKTVDAAAGNSDKNQEKALPERIGRDDFISILLAGMQELEYSATPPVPDQVVVGSLEHTRLSGVKVIFAVGLNEGSVPSVQVDSGFYSDWERQSMKRFGEKAIVLAEDRKTSIFKAQLTIFMSLLQATDELYFSYATTGMDGKTLRPANLFYQIRRMFPHNEIKNVTKWWREHQQVTYPLPTLHSFLRQLQEGRENSDFFRIYQTLRTSEMSAAISRLLEPLPLIEERIEPAVAEKLYQSQRRMSVSRLESYSACPFLHFIRYGIRAREIMPYQAARVDIGVFLHKVMETVFALCQKRKKQIFELSEEEYRHILSEAVQAGFAADKRNIFEAGARNRFLAERLAEVADRAVQTAQRQLRHGEMSFYREEIRFRPENMANLRFFTEDGQEFYLEGVIDRMDTSREGDTIYFSILDYKTSEHSLDYTEIFYGLQLQLLIYLKAGEHYLQEANGTMARPISAAYFHLKNPLFGQEDLGGEKDPSEEDFLKAMRLKGVFVAETLTKMDKTLQTANQSLVMNVRLKNDGSPYSGVMVLPAEELSGLEDFAKKKVEQIAGNIWRGDTAIQPYYYNKKLPCTYCAYAGICKVDVKKEPYRYLQKKEKEDLL